MKISKLLTALAVAAAVAGFASCSNSSDTPVVPVTPATPATPEGPAVPEGPSVKITGSNVIAAAATSLVGEPTRTNLYAFPSNFGTDTIKFTWSVVEGIEHVENPTNVYDRRLEVYSKDGDTSVESADQTFKVKVVVQSATNASKKAEAEYTVTILKKTTDEAGRVPLKFIEWMPDFSYEPDNDVATSERTYKPATGETAAVNPGNEAYFVTPTPIYNGYSANQSSGAFRKGWIFTTSDTTVAAILDSAGAKKSEATYTDANGTGAKALIVNKTEKESVDLTVAGEYKLSDDVKPAFTKKVTRKVAKGRKITVKLLKGTANTLYYKGSDVTSTGIVLDDVYAGVDYVTEDITGDNPVGDTVFPGVPAKGLINNTAGALATTATAYYRKVTFRVKYDAADNSEFDVKWTND